jgi:hypothetical protein
VENKSVVNKYAKETNDQRLNSTKYKGLQGAKGIQSLRKRDREHKTRIPVDRVLYSPPLLLFEPSPNLSFLSAKAATFLFF